ncbi:hypothetical protein PTKIN_Ptkin05aG0053300 [Pterospermum kingtungense]
MTRREDNSRTTNTTLQANTYFNLHYEGSTEINDWCFFIKTKRSKRGDWYGAAAMLRNDIGDAIVLCRSCSTSSAMVAKILILREILWRRKAYGAANITCYDGKKFCLKIVANKQPINWELAPTMSDINTITKEIKSFSIIEEWHPLSKEVQHLAAQAAENFISFSWP